MVIWLFSASQPLLFVFGSCDFPIIIVQTAFYAFLIAALLSYTNLNTNNEIIVLRSCGLNFWKITRPAICIGLVVSALVFFVNEIQYGL